MKREFESFVLYIIILASSLFILIYGIENCKRLGNLLLKKGILNE